MSMSILNDEASQLARATQARAGQRINNFAAPPQGQAMSAPRQTFPEWQDVSQMQQPRPGLGAAPPLDLSGYQSGMAQAQQAPSQGTAYNPSGGISGWPLGSPFNPAPGQQPTRGEQYRPTSTGQIPNWANQLPFGGQTYGMQPFQFVGTDFMGGQYSDPTSLTAQQGAMAMALLQQRQDQIQRGQGLSSLNPQLAYQQGLEMLQNGWQNPFAEQPTAFQPPVYPRQEFPQQEQLLAALQRQAPPPQLAPPVMPGGGRRNDILPAGGGIDPALDQMAAALSARQREAAKKTEARPTAPGNAQPIPPPNPGAQLNPGAPQQPGGGDRPGMPGGQLAPQREWMNDSLPPPTPNWPLEQRRHPREDSLISPPMWWPNPPPQREWMDGSLPPLGGPAVPWMPIGPSPGGPSMPTGPSPGLPPPPQNRPGQDQGGRLAEQNRWHGAPPAPNPSRTPSATLPPPPSTSPALFLPGSASPIPPPEFGPVGGNTRPTGEVAPLLQPEISYKPDPRTGKPEVGPDGKPVEYLVYRNSAGGMVRQPLTSARRIANMSPEEKFRESQELTRIMEEDNARRTAYTIPTLSAPPPAKKKK